MRISAKKISVSELCEVKANQRKVKENVPRNKCSITCCLVSSTINISY